MAEAVIGLGSNIGNGQVNLCRAWKIFGLEPDVHLQGLSSPYATEPVGMASKNWFTNGVGFANTNLPPRELLGVLHRIETALGRNRASQQQKWVDRTVDLDLLFYDDLVCATPELVVPHPGIQDRLFVLMPLAELLPDKRHPVSGLTAAQMLTQLLIAGSDAMAPPEVRKMQWRQDALAHLK
jgi:2-amino-4-hydroxy-6-hydroxymethyldihydropteridine diphosphokinase